MDALEMTLLFDYYGELLTERQRSCLDLRYNQDLSLGEIAQELGVSRQGVHDTLNRAEAVLRDMEKKTGFVQRSVQIRKAMHEIRLIAQQLSSHPDKTVSTLAGDMISAIQGLEE